LGSYKALYHVLEQWAHLEGFYTLPAAFPWCLLVLVRFEAGALVAEVLRFWHDAAGNSTETRTRIFEVGFADENGSRAVRSTVTFHDEAGPVSAPGAMLGPLPATVAGAGRDVRRFRFHEAILPRWIAARKGFCVQVGCEQPTLPARAEADEEEDWADALDCWDPGHDVNATITSRMIEQLLKAAGGSLNLALVRSPEDYMLADMAAPQLRPGLYVGDYGHNMYGQFAHEVLLIEYKEIEGRNAKSLFERPFEGGDVPQEIRNALEEVSATGAPCPTSFLMGTKITGDIHVPAGQKTFVALCTPEPLRDSLCRERGLDQMPTNVINRRSRRQEPVIRCWPGFGTLAFPGFAGPSWAPGWLVQLGDGPVGDRFGFTWSRDQDVVVLECVQAQAAAPFLNRKWLPEALQ